jgi:hypothetical protein
MSNKELALVLLMAVLLVINFYQDRVDQENLTELIETTGIVVENQGLILNVLESMFNVGR